MQRLMLLALLVFSGIVAPAQVAVRVDNLMLNESTVSGSTMIGIYPAVDQKLVDLKSGTPFFNDSWRKSKVVTESGKIYTDVPVRINLFKKEIHYKDASGKEMVINTPVSEIMFDEGDKKIHFVNGNILPVEKEGWFQLLVNDSVTLVKGFRKFLESQTPYGGGKEFYISTTEEYFAFYKDAFFEIKKPSDFTTVMPGKKSAIQESARNLSSRLTRQEQITAMALFVNTLLK